MANLTPDLRKFGYAPGKYMSKCQFCGEQKWDLDKRATSCRPCAIERYEQLISEDIPPTFRELMVDVKALFEKDNPYWMYQLDLFRHVYHHHLKQWGTFQQMVPMMLVLADGTKRQFGDMVSDPNIKNDSNFGGLGGEGFMCEVTDRERNWWQVSCCDKVFTFTRIVNNV